MVAALGGRTALVTGVSRRAGIGFGIAQVLAERGADLFVHAWPGFDVSTPWGADPDGPAALAEEIAGSGARVERIEADFEDPGAPQRVMAAAVEAFGHVDILVANHAHSGWQSLDALTAEETDRHLHVNVRATLLLVQAFAAQHDGRPGGRVVLFTSGQDRGAMPRELAYAASKGALLQVTPSLSAALMPRGITVNCVNPGPTDSGWPGPAEREAVIRRMPLGRWGEPEDVARLVAWLASDEGAWLTGQVIESDGGFRHSS